MNGKKYTALNIITSSVTAAAAIFFAIAKSADEPIVAAPIRLALGGLIIVGAMILLVYIVSDRRRNRAAAQGDVAAKMDELLFNVFMPMFAGSLLLVSGLYLSTGLDGASFYMTLVMFLIGNLVRNSLKRR